MTKLYGNAVVGQSGGPTSVINASAYGVIRAALDKFYHKQYTEKLFRLLDQGGTPFDEDLLSCDHKRCAQCSYRNECTYDEAKSVLRLVGQTYTKFTDGQNRENFKI